MKIKLVLNIGFVVLFLTKFGEAQRCFELGKVNSSFTRYKTKLGDFFALGICSGTTLGTTTGKFYMILLFVTNKVTLKLHHRNVHQWLSRHLQEHFGLQLVSLLEVGWKLHMLSYLLIPRFSFDHTNGFCGLLSDCPTLDKSCQQCLSGKFDLDNIQNAQI